MSEAPWSNHMDNVLSYLEYLGFPEYIEHFRAEDVALTMSNVIVNMYYWGVSPRMTAITVFGLTLWKIKYHINIRGNQIIH